MVSDEEELKGEKRKTPPLGVKLQSALRQLVEAWRALGKIPADVPDEAVKLQFDHFPALGLRDVHPETRKYIPDQHDPEYLQWLYQPTHDIKTRGRGATTKGSDIGEITKTRHLVEQRRERERRAAERAAIEAGEEPPPPPKRQKPKRKWQSRGFDKGHRPLRGGSSFQRKEKRNDR